MFVCVTTFKFVCFSRGLGEYVHCQIVSDAPNLSQPKAISSPSSLFFSCLLTTGCHHSPFENNDFPSTSFCRSPRLPFPLSSRFLCPASTLFHFKQGVSSQNTTCTETLSICFPQLYLISHMLNICSID